ncbi:hypothetical protein AGMMS49545_02930 [Betaproteobacteria bacterium]|nr:hypothetical protein AGMMS49545_02930 [Betaproteobacteria bacterium]
MMRINGQQQTALLPITFMERLRSKNLMRGQATIMAFATLLFLVLMTLATYNISQMTHGKMQTMNAADAGAYAAAIVAARDANFIAYTNRAMVANHVVVGQLVSMTSLAAMFEDMAMKLKWVMRILGLIPPLAFLQKVADVLEEIENTLAKVPEYMAKIISAQDKYINALSWLQSGVRALTLSDAEEAVEKVIKANDKNEELKWKLDSGIGALTIANNVNAFLNLSSQKNDDKNLSRFADVVRNSRDGFTTRRNWGPPDLFAILIGGDDNVFQGGTNLSSDNKTWVGLDGLKVTWLDWDWDDGCWPCRDEEPLAYGGAVTGSSSASDYRRIINMTRRTRDAAYNARKTEMANSYNGLRPYHELNKIGEGHDKSLPFVVLVYKAIDNKGTPNANKTFGTGAGDNFYRLEERRKELMGVAAAETYFKRPSLEDYRNGDKTASALYINRRGYEKGVYASLFSPYWQARLTNLSPEAATALGALD